MANMFSIDDYLVESEELLPKERIPVCLPGDRRFRLKKNCVQNAYLLCHQKRRWYIVHPDVVDQEPISNIQYAELYLGLMENGDVFLLPVTHPAPGQSASWYDGWLTVVDAAQKAWVRIEKDEEEKCHVVVDSGKNAASLPQWPKLNMKECLGYAFAKKHINSVEQLMQIAKKSSRNSIDVDVD